MAGREKALRFSEGVAVGAPSFTFLEASNVPSYSSDANFVAAKGSAAQRGDMYFNTVSNILRMYNGGAWQNVGSGGAASEGTYYDGVYAAESIKGASDGPKAVSFYVWPCLKINAGSSWIDINEGTGEISTQILPSDSVFLEHDLAFPNNSESGHDFARVVQDALNANASLTLTYAVSFDTSTRKFTIAAGANFSLLWFSGTNAADSLGIALGFDVSGDDSGTNTFTSDVVLEDSANVFYKELSFVVRTDSEIAKEDVNFDGIVTADFDKGDICTVNQLTEIESFSNLTPGARYYTKCSLITVSGANMYIDFREGAGAELNTVIELGNYYRGIEGVVGYAELCAAIKAALESVGGLSYTVTFDKNLEVFTIAATGAYTILGATGANTGNTLLAEIGFSDVDTTSAISHASDIDLPAATGAIGISGDARVISSSIYVGRAIDEDGSSLFVTASPNFANTNLRHGYAVDGTSKDIVVSNSAPNNILIENGILDGLDMWSTTGNMNTARRHLSGSGIQNAALSFGGYVAANSAVTEKFNGSTWTATGNLNTARPYLAGAGTQNAALGFGGDTGAVSAVTEKFNGSTWAASGNLNTARGRLAGAGTQNAALGFGGYIAAVSAVTEKFNGSTWAVSGNLNTAIGWVAGAGTQNAALSFGGLVVTFSAISEKFNGSTWTATGSLITARRSLAGAGTQSAALSFGGETGPASSLAEKFNGSTWTATGSLNTARSDLGGCGAQNSSLSFGGLTSVNVATTEKYHGRYTTSAKGFFIDSENKEEFAAYQHYPIKRGASLSVAHDTVRVDEKSDSVLDLIALDKYGEEYWYVVASMNTTRQGCGAAGTQNAALGFGGSNGSYLTSTEKYNGSTWTASGGMNTARQTLAGAGTQNAALSFGGDTGAFSAVTEKFNGSTWGRNAGLNTARSWLAGCGIQNAALSFGGDTGAVSAVTEKYNSSTWTATGNLNTARNELGGCGIQNAALSFGGFTGAISVVTEKFNGSTWSTVAGWNLITGKRYTQGTGLQNAALNCGGYIAAVTPLAEKFNGSVWTASGNLNTARYASGASGTQNAALSFGGFISAFSAVTEKFLASELPSKWNWGVNILSSNPLSPLN